MLFNVMVLRLQAQTRDFIEESSPQKGRDQIDSFC
jgi:hypothetical protein